MELKDILLDEGFSNMEIPEKTGKTSEDNSFNSLGTERIDSLKEIIKEIEELILERENLSSKVCNEAEKIKTEISNFLLTTTASDSEGFKERNGLRQKQIDISELQLNEKVNCWKDVALLKKELREKQKELNEKQDRMKILQQIGE